MFDHTMEDDGKENNRLYVGLGINYRKIFFGIGRSTIYSAEFIDIGAQWLAFGFL